MLLLPLLTLLLAPVAPLDRYTGALLGVRAEVQLDRADRRAHVALQGVVLGGGLEGDAHFDDDGGVALDAPLARALQRRGVSIVSVVEKPLQRAIELKVRLPIFGIRTMALREEQQAIRAAGAAGGRAPR